MASKQINHRSRVFQEKLFCSLRIKRSLHKFFQSKRNKIAPFTSFQKISCGPRVRSPPPQVMINALVQRSCSFEIRRSLKSLTHRVLFSVYSNYLTGCGQWPVCVQDSDVIKCSALSPCGKWMAYSTASTTRLYCLSRENNHVQLRMFRVSEPNDLKLGNVESVTLCL